MSSPAEPLRYARFTVSDRLEHWAQILTFVPLAITGLVQRYSGGVLSRGIIDLLGGIETVRNIHRVFAAALMVAVVYHVGAIGYRRHVLGIPRSMGFGRADIKAAGHTLAYLLGRRESHPPQGRYTFEEKAEYWSLVWGTALMVVTGFLLWNPIASATFLPGSFIPAAKAAHGGEAVLAVLAIIFWHMYHVHVRSFNKSMFSGYLPLEDMERDHSLVLAAEATDPPPAGEKRRRQRRYLPLYSSGAVVLLVGVWLFVSFEDTAIQTIEPLEDPVVFAPVTTTTTTAATTTTTDSGTTTTGGQVTSTTETSVVAAGFGWSDFEGSFRAECSVCHRADVQFGGLSLADFEAALAGGDGGPAIVPGDPDASPVVTVQEAGAHPGQLSAAVLADLRTWIADGAPEVAGGPTTGTGATTTTVADTTGAVWGDFASLLATKCGACHGASQQFGGLSLADYAAALAGGDGGPAIVPGDAANSTIVIIQMAGGHPGQLTDAELADLRTWIDAGAPEQ